jgi:hypothetical protein
MKSGSNAGLIGFTGFVGGTLLRDGAFENLYNSSNIDEIRGRSFELLVCAGVPAVKWLANRDPESDRATIHKLIGSLERVEADEFILISTIDVYPDPASEADEFAEIDPGLNHAYGRHRYELELWVRHRFPRVRIVRLPALFGRGLRKNALFDLLHDNEVGDINPSAVFQWYPTKRLHRDIELTRAKKLDLVNLFPEPIALSDIIERHFPQAKVALPSNPAPRYDLRTRYGDLFNGFGGYIARKASTLKDMAEFITEERGAALPGK